jgi:hypothetical protein
MISNQIENDYGEVPVVCKDLSFDSLDQSLGVDEISVQSKQFSMRSENDCEVGYDR